MKKNPIVHDALDETLSSVSFTARDMRGVIRAVRSAEEPELPPVRRHPYAARMAACAIAVALITPLTVFTLRAQSLRNPTLSSIPTSKSVTKTMAKDKPLAENLPAPNTLFTEDDAIARARFCFERQCDTSIFSFEEYTVSVSYADQGTDSGEYTIELTSLYDNGCTFTVVVSAPDGIIVRYSSPDAATQPAHLLTDSAEVQAWYEKNGPYRFTWSQSEQIEFSRRYEGGKLRAAKVGELSVEEAVKLAAEAAYAQCEGMGSAPYCYPVLCAERAAKDGVARYVVYCYAQAVTDNVPSLGVQVTMRAADGALESVVILGKDDHVQIPQSGY